MILLIEDEEILRFTFKSFLSKEGYKVVSAEDYDSALEIISGTDLDLIIADIILKGHTGLDILKEVRERDMQCPVIMITGKPSIESAAEAVRLGAYDYLTKPVQKEALLRIAGQALRYKAILDERDQIEDEKEKLRSDLEAIFSSVQEGIVTVDSRMRVMKANKAFERICGPILQEIVGRKFDEIPSQCNSSCSSVLTEALQTQKEVRAVRVECRHDDKKRQMVVLTGSPLKDRFNNYTGAALVIRDVTRESDLERELKKRRQFQNIIGESNKMQQVYELLENLADSDTTALITGESGTGKELVANALHYSGNRARKPFVKVNCSALADALLEFTGAVQDKIGRFELADGGSILLDEIGDISPNIQLKLLRVIQEKEFERVGESKPVKVDVRIIATTNRNLKEKVKLNQFREDLYYRLKVVEVNLPSLRERIDDTPLLIDHFCKVFNRRFNKDIEGVSDEVSRTLAAFPWPGNVRELEHAIEHAFVLCHDRYISVEHLPPEIRENNEYQRSTSETKPGINRQAILQALEKTAGNKAKAARLLGISRKTIYRKLSHPKNSN
jgi:PAS domain S-box-containing protein